MFTDEQRSTVWEEIRQRDLRAFAHLLTQDVLAEAAQRAGLRLGTSALNLARMAWLAIASAVHFHVGMFAVLHLVMLIVADIEGCRGDPLVRTRRRAESRAGRFKRTRQRSKHSPKKDDPTTVTEEAFAQARQRVPLVFWAVLLVVLGERFAARHARWTRWKKFRLLALDGTTVTLPDWKRLRAFFGGASNGKGRQTTQARMVMLQLPLVRLPWRYELTPITEAERTVADRLLQGVRPDDLILMDRGLWSYGLFWKIQRQGGFFAVRRFASARLAVLRDLGPGDRLVEYAPTDPQWRKGGFPPAMPLRLIDYQIPGFRPSQVVTNVLEPAVISREEWIRLSTSAAAEKRLHPGLYHRRWEIETTFNELKVGQAMEKSIRGRTPASVRFEIAGQVLLYFLVRWLMVEAAEKHGVADPLRLGFTNALRTLRMMNQAFLVASPEWRRTHLLPTLLARIASVQNPLRPGRSYPRPNDGKYKNKGRGIIVPPHKLPPALSQT